VVSAGPERETQSKLVSRLNEECQIVDLILEELKSFKQACVEIIETLPSEQREVIALPF